LPARLHVSVQLALGLDVMPLPLGHAAPALPHLIRPPIG
ncbi:transcriptional regulator CopL, partial [Stenotrophomonas sp. NPDC077420]